MSLWRRHLKACAHRKKGRAYTKCTCPIWCDGEIDGRRYRESLDTRDWQRAIRKIAAIEDPRAPRVKTVAEAVTAFENHILSLEPSTQRKYRNVLAHLAAYCERKGVHDVMQLTVEHLDAFRATRRLSPTTATKELQTLRQFLAFCLERRWAEDNAAKRIKLARNVKPEGLYFYRFLPSFRRRSTVCRVRAAPATHRAISSGAGLHRGGPWWGSRSAPWRPCSGNQECLAPMRTASGIRLRRRFWRAVGPNRTLRTFSESARPWCASITPSGHMRANRESRGCLKRSIMERIWRAKKEVRSLTEI